MPSTFLLHGGSTNPSAPSNQWFWKRVVADLTDGAKVISVAFAMEGYSNHVLQGVLEDEIVAGIRSANAELKFDLASVKSIVSTEELIKAADLVYVHGGDGDRLQFIMSRAVPNLKELVKDGKTIVGNSAGANMWSTCYYSNDNAAICDGMSVLPIKTFCHYQPYKWRQLTELQRHKVELPIIPLGNYGHVALKFV